MARYGGALEECVSLNARDADKDNFEAESDITSGIPTPGHKKSPTLVSLRSLGTTMCLKILSVL